MAAGRPPKDKYNIKTMLETIEDYIKSSDLPILKEVCLLNDWNYDYIMELQRKHKELSQSIKKLLMKKEVVVEKGVHEGKLDRVFAIFTLKQPAHGWTDKEVLDIRGSDQKDDGLLEALNSTAKKVWKK